MQSELFQNDIFPPFESEEPGLTADEWFEGKNASPVLGDWKPGKEVTSFLDLVQLDPIKLPEAE